MKSVVIFNILLEWNNIRSDLGSKFKLHKDRGSQFNQHIFVGTYLTYSTRKSKHQIKGNICYISGNRTTFKVSTDYPLSNCLSIFSPYNFRLKKLLLFFAWVLVMCTTVSEQLNNLFWHTIHMSTENPYRKDAASYSYLGVDNR